jgi:hypothetical protein
MTTKDMAASLVRDLGWEKHAWFHSHGRIEAIPTAELHGEGVIGHGEGCHKA